MSVTKIKPTMPSDYLMVPPAPHYSGSAVQVLMQLSGKATSRYAAADDSFAEAIKNEDVTGKHLFRASAKELAFHGNRLRCAIMREMPEDLIDLLVTLSSASTEFDAISG